MTLDLFVPPGPGESAVHDSLERLVAALRRQPEDVAGRDTSLNALVEAAARATTVLEAGVENSFEIDDLGLKGRLLARRVDQIRIESGAGREELLQLARALADDVMPLESSGAVRVELVPNLQPPPPPTLTRPADGGRASRAAPALPDWIAPPRRESTSNTLAETIAQISASLGDGLQRGAWRAALHDVQALIRMVPAVPENQRRGFSISVRRYLTRTVFEAFVELALRAPEEQPRAIEVLRWSGLDAAEVVLDLIKASEAVGAREFLFTALAEMPDAAPLVLPFLTSPRWHEARHGADLLGRMGYVSGIPALRHLLDHPDERVRIAAVEALGRIPDKAALEPLRQALTHKSPQMRVRAGWALGNRRSGALAMPLLAALELEKDSTAWRELLAALSLIDSPESASAMVRLALEKKTLFGRGGRPTQQRLEVIGALARADTPSARLALQRIALEGDAAVKSAAGDALRLQ
ncbi:MAG: HEAT repeat domain-containing protein [Gemmatimonadota bacterium]